MFADVAFEDIGTQIKEFIRIVQLNPNIKILLETLSLPGNLPWYICAGCVNQTIWNYLTNRDITYGLGDYDIAYWDTDISKDKELIIQDYVFKKFGYLNVELEPINEARVHTWYEKDYGVPMDPYPRLESAIDSWPSTVTCVGITKVETGIKVYAPYGLSDIFGMKLRYNPVSKIPVSGVNAKIKKWTSKWPELQIVTGSYPGF